MKSFVKIGNAHQAHAADPVRRIIKVHARSLAKACYAGKCPPVNVRCESDAHQCRIAVNALRREIDRLLRGIDHYAISFWRGPQSIAPCNPSTSIAFDDCDRSESSAHLAGHSSSEGERRTYAVAALGAPLAPIPGDLSHNMYAAGVSQFHGTKGTDPGALIDVLI